MSPAFANGLPLQPAFFIQHERLSCWSFLFYFWKLQNIIMYTHTSLHSFCAERVYSFYFISFDISKVKGLYIHKPYNWVTSRGSKCQTYYFRKQIMLSMKWWKIYWLKLYHYHKLIILIYYAIEVIY